MKTRRTQLLRVVSIAAVGALVLGVSEELRLRGSETSVAATSDAPDVLGPIVRDTGHGHGDTVRTFDPGRDLSRTLTSSLDGTPHAAGQFPDGVAVGAGRVWVASRTKHSLVVLEEKTGTRIVGPIDLKGPPGAALYVHDAAWVTLTADKALARIDPQTFQVERITTGSTPMKIADGFGFLYTANFGDRTVSKIDPRTRLEVARSSDLGYGVFDITTSEDSVWVHLLYERVVREIDPETLAPTGRSVEVGPGASAIDFADGRVWVTQVGDGKLVGIDPSDPSRRIEVVVDPIVGQSYGPVAIVESRGALWIANNHDKTLSRFDLATEMLDPRLRHFSNRLATRRGLTRVAAGADAIWVTNYEQDKVISLPY